MKKGSKIFNICISIILIFCLIYVSFNYITVASLMSLEIKDNLKDDDKMILSVLLKTNKLLIKDDVWCYASNDKNDKDIKWVKSKNNICELEVEKGNYYIYIKNSYNYVKKLASKDVNLNKIKNVAFSKNDFYIPVGGVEEFKVNYEKYGIVDTDISYDISDKSILKIEGNKFIGLKKGNVEVVAKIGKKEVYANVFVMDSINEPIINTKKEYVTCNQFTEEESQLLDKVLADRVNSVGYQTRAGAVAAARFLALEFSYKIPYFYENGRLKNYDVIRHVDGEGRYYHQGLYLSESKFDSITDSYKGPAIWGCPLMNLNTEGRYRAGVKYPNGLDCSGFITWTLLNGGFDVGDVGAGDNPYRDDDLFDLGERVDTTMEILESGRVKVGDLIAYWGHMAMIVGIDKDNLYIAESLPNTKGVVVKPYKKEYAMELFVNIMLMDSIYKKDGNLTDYWE